MTRLALQVLCTVLFLVLVSGCKTTTPDTEQGDEPSTTTEVESPSEPAPESDQEAPADVEEPAADTEPKEETAAPEPEPSTEPEPSPEPTTPPATTGWKNYTHPALGYSMRIPNDWTVQESSPSASRKTTRIMSPDLFTYGNVVIELEGRSIEEIRDEARKDQSASETPVRIGNASGYQFRRAVAVETYVESGGLVYLVQASKFGNEVVQEILSSLRF